MTNPKRFGIDTTKMEGFSLLEVLVATALVGLMLVILLQVLSSIFRVEEGIWKNSRALLLGEKVLQENCALIDLKAGTYAGQVEDFVYQVQVTPQYEIRDSVGGPEILSSLIQVTVSWRERNNNRLLILETVRTAPKRK